MLDTGCLICDGCPAEHLCDIDRIEYVEALRVEALSALGGEPRWILLCESPPANRFVYDRDTGCSHGGLRFNLRNALVPGQDEEDLFQYLIDWRVWVCDAALCPLHRLDRNKDRRHAATICLERHTSVYLDKFPEARIVTIFPARCGFLKRKLRRVDARMEDEFDFSNLDGLRGLIDR